MEQKRLFVLSPQQQNEGQRQGGLCIQSTEFKDKKWKHVQADKSLFKTKVLFSKDMQTVQVIKTNKNQQKITKTNNIKIIYKRM